MAGSFPGSIAEQSMSSPKKTGWIADALIAEPSGVKKVLSNPLPQTYDLF